jgi:hypothetical protein
VTATAAGFRPTSSLAFADRMRAFAWLCIVAGILLAIAAFIIAANKPTINPWPSLVAGFCVTAVGIVLLTTERRPEDGEAR